MAFHKNNGEVLPERRGVGNGVDKSLVHIDSSLRNSRRGRRFNRVSAQRLLFWVFTLAVIFLVYLAIFGFNMHFQVKLENGLLPLRKEGPSMHDVLGGQEKSSQIGSFMHDVPRIEEKPFQDSALQQPMKKPHRQRFFPCEVTFLDSVNYFIEPMDSLNATQFSLGYVEREEKNLNGDAFEPLFGGHQSLKEREMSFYARNQTIHCGFVKGPKGFPSTGFDLDEEDKKYMSKCIIVVSSCIFGSSDFLRRPTSKLMSEYSKKNVCFAMFVDEQTLSKLSTEGHVPDDGGYIGLWKIIAVKNLPYKDMRKTGKVPKFLSHRLFPSSRYSIWLDSKLRLVVDPMLIIEHFLWRTGSEYAISNHYTRHCVWEEVLQNKRLNKYNHSAIDEQFNLYKSDGLTKFDALDPNIPLPSYVPEGSFIVRAHTPMSNLFSCLWFNEVDRFTSRDQLSFSYTYLKLRRMNPHKPFRLYMFKDCERRSLVKLFHHRDLSSPPIH